MGRKVKFGATLREGQPVINRYPIAPIDETLPAFPRVLNLRGFDAGGPLPGLETEASTT